MQKHNATSLWNETYHMNVTRNLFSQSNRKFGSLEGESPQGFLRPLKSNLN